MGEAPRGEMVSKMENASLCPWRSLFLLIPERQEWKGRGQRQPETSASLKIERSSNPGPLLLPWALSPFALLYWLLKAFDVTSAPQRNATSIRAGFTGENIMERVGFELEPGGGRQRKICMSV